MKKIQVKKIVTIAMLAVIGLFSLVAMKFPRENFPELGINPNPPVIQERCVGCPAPLKIVNNSTCERLKAVLGFTASQTNAAGNTVTSGIFTIEPIFFSAPDPNFEITKEMIDPHVTSPIITTQIYTLPTGGIDIYASDYTTLIGNIKPGEMNKRVAKKDANGNELTGLCDCYIVSWDTTTNTITISDC